MITQAQITGVYESLLGQSSAMQIDAIVRLVRQAEEEAKAETREALLVRMRLLELLERRQDGGTRGDNNKHLGGPHLAGA